MAAALGKPAVGDVILSVCIPSYNRKNLVGELVLTLLSVNEQLQVCVHIDGSEDGTLEFLSKISDPRLTVTSAPNAGRAHALSTAIMGARGAFAMVFDDDDLIYPDAIESIVQRCRGPLSADVAGFIYHMDSDTGVRLGSDFPHARSNFLKLRADERVLGDKKEVVRTELLKSVLPLPAAEIRRIPTSLYWSRIALTHDVECINSSVGIKNYLPNGMTSRARFLKLRDPYPMSVLYICRVRAFFARRYQSKIYFFRSLTAFLFYRIRATVNLL